MIAAAMVANTTPDKSHSIHQEYRTWVFTMASFAFHEISHIFITYLSNALEITPPSIKARVGSSADNEEGEAGRNLEERVFGGIVTFRREALFQTADEDVCSDIVTPLKGNLLRSQLKCALVRRTILDHQDRRLVPNHAGNDQQDCRMQYVMCRTTVSRTLYCY